MPVFSSKILIFINRHQKRKDSLFGTCLSDQWDPAPCLCHVYCTHLRLITSFSHEYIPRWSPCSFSFSFSFSFSGWREGACFGVVTFVRVNGRPNCMHFIYVTSHTQALFSPKNYPNFFKIRCHIKSCDICIEH